jgi:hypothetical protein
MGVFDLSDTVRNHLQRAWEGSEKQLKAHRSKSPPYKGQQPRSRTQPAAWIITPAARPVATDLIAEQIGTETRATAVILKGFPMTVLIITDTCRAMFAPAGQDSIIISNLRWHRKAQPRPSPCSLRSPTDQTFHAHARGRCWHTSAMRSPRQDVVCAPTSPGGATVDSLMKKVFRPAGVPRRAGTKNPRPVMLVSTVQGGAVQRQSRPHQRGRRSERRSISHCGPRRAAVDHWWWI